MMSAPYMPLYCGDYLGDTRHLTTEQHGAYLLLLMCMWRSGGYLTSDPKKLASMCGLSLSRWAKHSDDILSLFNESEGRIFSVRLQKELQKFNEKSEKNSRNGKAGAIAKSLKTKETDKANASSSPKQPEPEPEQIKDVVLYTRDEWPENSKIVDILIAESGIKLTNADTWHLMTSQEISLWKHNGFDFWQEVLPTIKAQIDGGRKPNSWKYFTPIIAQCRADRTKPISIPEARNEPASNRGSRASGYEGTVDAFAAANEILARKASQSAY